MKVPWMAKGAIAAAAAALVADYQMKVAEPVSPPIPVEDIIERGLGLNLAFSDLRTRLQMPDVLGATYVERHLICIDQSLIGQTGRGRLHFTCAHEAGHWVMHRKFITAAGRTDADGSSIFCRVRDAKRPLEWQADYFAANLLMPAADVRHAFSRLCGDKPLVIFNSAGEFCGPISFDPSVRTWPRIAVEVMAAGGFSNVSKQAMIIRLQDLGLVRNEAGVPMTWAASHGLV